MLTTLTTTPTIPERRENMKCPHCNYEFKPRVAKPKRCPCCQKWINKPKNKAKKQAGVK
jgi:predicted Zn-ribbon and HTH transcriptional regulator